MPRLVIRVLGLIILLSMVLPVVGRPALAQSESSIVLVYTNLQDSLVVYNGGTQSTTTLLAADDTRRYDYEIHLSPSKKFVAVYTVSFEKGAVNRSEFDKFTYSLDVFTLPAGETVLHRNLLPETYVFRTGVAEIAPGTQTFELPEALGEMAWARTADQLAWVEGVDGADANVFVWNATDESVTALADQTGYPSRLRWSPSDDRLAYVAVETFLSDNGPTAYDVYIATTDGSAIDAIPLEDASQYQWLIDWVDEESLLWSPFDGRAGALGLFLYSTTTQENSAVVAADQPISITAWDVVNNIAAFAVPSFTRDEEGATPQSGLTPGAYVVRDLDQGPELLVESDIAYGVSFTLPGYLAVGSDIVVRLSDNSKLELSELRRPDYSPDGSYALADRQSQTFIRNLKTDEETLVANLYYLDGLWLDNNTFIAQVGAYGSVIGIGSVGGRLTNLVEDVGDGPFVGFLPE